MKSIFNASLLSNVKFVLQPRDLETGCVTWNMLLIARQVAWCVVEMRAC